MEFAGSRYLVLMAHLLYAVRDRTLKAPNNDPYTGIDVLSSDVARSRCFKGSGL
jgi:hypothetical protein